MGGKPFEVTAPDPYTVVIKTPSPNAALVECVANLRIMPKHVLEESFNKGDFASAYNVGTPPDKIVTSGPWRVTQYVPGEKTVLGRNPYFFGVDKKNQRLPYLDELVFVIVPDLRCRRFEVSRGRAARAGRCETGKLRLVRGQPAEEQFHAVRPRPGSEHEPFLVQPQQGPETHARKENRRSVRRSREVFLVQRPDCSAAPSRWPSTATR